MSSAFQVVQGLAHAAPAVDTRCELCRTPIQTKHEHILELGVKRLLCTCLPCAYLFDSPNATKYRRVPRQVTFLSDFTISDADWDSLAIPIGMAFFVKNGASGKISAVYPSPAGPVESLLSLDAWADAVSDHPSIRAMETDVEALLVNQAAGEYFLAPIDECFRLVGLIRTHWRGLSGGTEVWREIQAFFNELKVNAYA